MSQQMLFRKSDKRGISVMIGYVLLVTFAIIISVIVYGWLESYVPKDEVECEEGVSLSVYNYSCDGDTLELTLKNDGVFSLAGFTIYCKEDPDEDVASIDLSKNFTGSKTVGSGRIYFSSESADIQNVLEPGDRSNADDNPLTFDIPEECKIGEGDDQTIEAELTPVKMVDWNDKEVMGVCGRSSIRETMRC